MAAWLGQAFALAGVFADPAVSPGLPVRAAAWPAGAAVPRFRHVFLIVLENRSPTQVLGPTGLPYLSRLARRYAVETNDWAALHPSLPNYLALLGGSTFGVRTDCAACVVRAPDLVDRLQAAHLTWGAYMEGLPATGWLGAIYWPGLYAGKHDPFRYFHDIRDRSDRRDRIQPLDRLWPLLRRGGVPDFVWITPNLCHDMHSCPAIVGDLWLRLVVPRILRSRAWRDGGVLFITFDEGGSGRSGGPGRRGGRIPLIAVSPSSRRGGRLDALAGEPNLLATIEAAFRLPCLAESCGARPLGGLFRRSD
jgi:hypothetical protein